MARKRRNNQRRNGGKRKGRRKQTNAASLPLVVARGVKLMRSVQLYTKIESTAWLDNLLYYGMYAMKLYKVAVGHGIQATNVPAGSMQSFYITLGDLLVHSPFSLVMNSKCKSNFGKGKLHSLQLKLVSTAAPSNRSGRIGLQVDWLSEAEALAAAGELNNSHTNHTPSLQEFFSTSGVSVASVSQGLSRTYSPPRGSWIRDYIAIGCDSGTDSSKGLPVCLLTVGIQTLDSSKSSEAYVSGDIALMLDIIGRMDLAEMDQRDIEPTIRWLLDANKIALITPSGLQSVENPSGAQCMQSSSAASITSSFSGLTVQKDPPPNEGGWVMA